MRGEAEDAELFRMSMTAVRDKWRAASGRAADSCIRGCRDADSCIRSYRDADSGSLRFFRRKRVDCDNKA